MAVRTHDEIMESIRKRLGEDTSDEALALIEDVSDTLKSSVPSDEWKKKYEENDKMWREKYRDRFFNGSNDADKADKELIGEEDEHEEEDNSPHTYEDLFKGKE